VALLAVLFGSTQPLLLLTTKRSASDGIRAAVACDGEQAS
jgi:hypothetical protein